MIYFSISIKRTYRSKYIGWYPNERLARQFPGRVHIVPPRNALPIEFLANRAALLSTTFAELEAEQFSP